MKVLSREAEDDGKFGGLVTSRTEHVEMRLDLDNNNKTQERPHDPYSGSSIGAWN